MTRREFALRLAMTPSVGGRSVIRILARCDLLNMSPSAFFKLSPEALKEDFRLNARQTAALAAARKDKDTAEKVLDRLERLGVSWVTMLDAHYPQRLEAFEPDPPGVLFLYGNARLLESQTFAVLSSRRTTRAGLEQMERLCEEGVLQGNVLTAGHDTPEYQRAAIVPLRWGSPRILVLDRGLFQALGENLTEEPFRAARLWRFQFDPKTDLVISPFRPDAHFAGVANRVRDRLIGGLSMRADFVEVSPGGNMERIAKDLLKTGRPVRISDRSVSFRALEQLGAAVLSS